jgi:hypothetical protein
MVALSVQVSRIASLDFGIGVAVGRLPRRNRGALANVQNQGDCIGARQRWSIGIGERCDPFGRIVEPALIPGTYASLPLTYDRLRLGFARSSIR